MALKSEWRVWTIEWLALCAVGLTVICFSLNKIPPTDVSWHLATAREAFSSGSWLGVWPKVNTFSYTFANEPLSQQYPLFQGALWWTYQFFGWTGLSIFHCAAWTVIFLVWSVWSGGLRYAARFHLLWAFVALGLQQRMSLRPEVFSMALFAILLIALDRCLLAADAKSRWRSAAEIAVVQWLMVLSHQFFILGFAVQIAYLLHLLAVKMLRGRFGTSTRDQRVPLLPQAAALTASVLLCAFSPLGWEILLAPLKTFGTLAHHRLEVVELTPVSRLPYVQILIAISAVLAAAGIYLQRRALQPCDLALLAIGAAIASVGWRGVSFFVVISAAILSRSLKLRADAGPPRRGRLGMLRLCGLSLTFGFCVFVIQIRWISAEGPGLGLGKAVGQWPDRAMSAMRADPPPGKGINLCWYSGNYLIWGLFPIKQVFVDPRFEAYPRDFLLQANEACSNPRVFAEVIEKYRPDWFLGEVRPKDVVQRGAELYQTGGWTLTYLDDLIFLLVRNTPETEAYRARHPVDIKLILSDTAAAKPALQYFALAFGLVANQPSSQL